MAMNSDILLADVNDCIERLAYHYYWRGGRQHEDEISSDIGHIILELQRTKHLIETSRQETSQ